MREPSAFNAVQTAATEMAKLRRQLTETQMVLEDKLAENGPTYPRRLAYWASERALTIVLLKKILDARGAMEVSVRSNVRDLLMLLERSEKEIT